MLTPELIGLGITVIGGVIAVCVFFERLRYSIDSLTAVLSRIERTNSEEHKNMLDAFAKVGHHFESLETRVSGEHKDMVALMHHNIFQPIIEMKTQVNNLNRSEQK